jgi:3-dehydroquinate synthase
MEQQKVIISQHLALSVSQALADCSYDCLFVLVDETTERLCLPVLATIFSESGTNYATITIGAGDLDNYADAIAEKMKEK